MTKRNTVHSPNFTYASKVRLPECDATADLIVRLMVEGYPDGFTKREQERKRLERAGRMGRAA